VGQTSTDRTVIRYWNGSTSHSVSKLTNRHEYELLLKTFGTLQTLYEAKNISVEKAYNEELQNMYGYISIMLQ